jgi:hypothetical protein
MSLHTITNQQDLHPWQVLCGGQHMLPENHALQDDDTADYQDIDTTEHHRFTYRMWQVVDQVKLIPQHMVRAMDVKAAQVAGWCASLLFLLHAPSQAELCCAIGTGSEPYYLSLIATPAGHIGQQNFSPPSLAEAPVGLARSG